MAEFTNEQIKRAITHAPKEPGTITDVYLNGSAIHYRLRSAKQRILTNFGTDWVVISLKQLEEILSLREKLDHLVQTDRAVYTRAAELSERVEKQKDSIFTLREQNEQLRNQKHYFKVTYISEDPMGVFLLEQDAIDFSNKFGGVYAIEQVDF